MPKTRKHRDYRFHIEAYSPDTMPMARLADYLADLAKMLGQEKSVHFLKVEGGVQLPSSAWNGRRNRRSGSACGWLKAKKRRMTR